MPRSIARRTGALWPAGLLALAMAGCAGPGGSSSPTPVTGGPPLTATELRLALVHELGPLWYCDRDEHPVGRDELAAMREAWPQVVADSEQVEAILGHLGLAALAIADLTDGQRLEVYRVWKVVSAISLEDIGPEEGRFRFDYLAQPAPAAQAGTRTAGIIDTTGAITIEQQAAAGEPMCPICLDRATPIDTPTGSVRVDRLRLGDAVWTLDRGGRRVAGAVIALGSTPAPTGHDVIRLTLIDTRSIRASPGHALADGRTLADLEVGDAVDGSRVAALERVRYSGGETFDLVVAGETGVYFAGGIPLGSTLDRAAPSR